jgi:transposase-like protein
MKKPRPSYTEGFKTEAIKRVKENKESIGAVAKDVGVNRVTLSNWINGKGKKKKAKAVRVKVAKKVDLMSLVAEKNKLESKLLVIKNKILTEVGMATA